MSHLKYRPEIDGLRAVAILPVVLYHAGFQTFGGGFVGVDVFFVISGYLITLIILSEKRNGSFTLVNFYERRMRRIFPALFLMMAVCYPIAWLVQGPGEMEEFSGSVVSTALFFSNFYFWKLSGYFATAAELKPLLHTWSLAVEEQFYLFFPALLLLTWRLGPRVQLFLLGAAAVASLGIAQWLMPAHASTAFFLLPARLWELLLGSIAAYWLQDPRGANLQSHPAASFLTALGIAMIVAAVLGFDSDTPFPGFTALLPCLGTVLVIIFVSQRNVTGIMLASRPMVAIGLVSYSFYLWHYPLLAFTRHATGTDSILVLGAVCLLSLGIAALSWRFVERPARQARGVPVFKVFALSAAGAVVLSGLGAIGQATDGYRDIYLLYRLDAATRKNYELYQRHTERGTLAARDGGDCILTTARPDAAFGARFEACARRHGKALLLVGDSHAANIHNALIASGRHPFIASFWRGGCRPYKPKPECPYDTIAPFIERYGSSLAQVVLHISGSHLLRDHLGREDSNAAFVAGNPGTIAVGHIDDTIAYIANLPRGADIVWLGPFAEARVIFEDPESFSPQRLQFSAVSLDLFSKLDRELKDRTAAHTGFRYVSLVDRLGFDAGSLIQGECMTFSDEDHFSACGEDLFSGTISESLTPPR